MSTFLYFCVPACFFLVKDLFTERLPLLSISRSGKSSLQYYLDKWVSLVMFRGTFVIDILGMSFFTLSKQKRSENVLMHHWFIYFNFTLPCFQDLLMPFAFSNFRIAFFDFIQGLINFFFMHVFFYNGLVHVSVSILVDIFAGIAHRLFHETFSLGPFFLVISIFDLANWACFDQLVHRFWNGVK